MAPVFLLARSSPLGALRGRSSSSHTAFLVQRSRYTPVTFHPRTLHPAGPTPPLHLRIVLTEERAAAPVRCFPVGIQRAAHIKGSPLPSARDKALVLRSRTTRRANLQFADGSSGIPRLGASPYSPWLRARILPHSTRSPVRCHARRVPPAAPTRAGPGTPASPQTPR
jgi:hypothetical protein